MSSRLLFVALLIPVLLPQAFSQQLQTVTIQGREAVAGELIVKLKPQNAMAKAAQTAAKANLLRQCGASVKTTWITGTELWKVHPQDMERVHDLLKNNPLVDYAYPNYMSVKPVESSGKIPNDPEFSKQWHLLNTGQGGGTVGADIRATEAWNITTGDSTIVAAILDTGVDVDHPDLKANVWKNKNEIPGNGLDDDNNGFVDDVYGWDFIANDNAPLAHNYHHGTACAGLIAAIQDNGVGISGVAPRVKMMPLRVMDSTGGPISASVSALEYAIKNGAKILNCSLASGGPPDRATDDMLKLVNDHGLLVVAAAGNDHADLDGSSKSYPAQYNYPNIVAVANSDFRDNLSTTSNFGQNEVDVAAPGQLTYTTTFGGSYFAYSGTSFSAPVVTGVAALVWSVFPTLTADQVRQQLILSSDLVPSLYTYSVSNGRVNAYRAVKGLYLSPLTMRTKSVDFGATKLHVPSVAKSVWIKNSSDNAVVVDSLILGTGFSFSATDTAMKKSTAVSIGARDSISVSVFFNPSVEGRYTGPLTLYDLNTSGQTVSMITSLEGIGITTGTIIDATIVSGTWTKAASPYVIYNSVEVSGQLVIEPGTVMKFGPESRMTVMSGATLLARASATDSILFAPLDPQNGWNGIKIERSGSDDTLSYCIFERVKYARAVYLSETSTVVTHCMFRQNGTAVIMAGGEEGGIVVQGRRGNPTIAHCVFYGNGASNGGALALRSVDSARINNLLFYNNSGVYGGAIYIQESTVELSNLTLYNNTATYGGAIDLYAGGTVDLINSIFWKNYAGARNPATSHTPPIELTDWASISPTTLRFKYCVIDTFPGWCKNDTSLTKLNKVEVGPTNLYSDPMFADLTNNEFRLGASSPAIDAGSPNYDIGQEPFPHGYRINLGYDGGTAGATKSWQTKVVAAPDEIRIDRIGADSTYIAEIHLKNGCATAITVNTLALSNTREFSLQNPPALPFVVQSGQTVTLRLGVKTAAQLDSTYTCLFTATFAGGQSEVNISTRAVIGTVVAGSDLTGLLVKSGSPYLVTQSVRVPSGSSLTIEPGVRLRFMKGTTLTVGQNARLVAIGSEQDSVYFTAAVPADGWSGIYLENSGDDDVLSYCVIAGARKIADDGHNLSTALTILSSSASVTHVTIRENIGLWNGAAIGIVWSSMEAPNPQLRHILIKGNSGITAVGFYSVSPGIRAENVRFTQNDVSTLFLVELYGGKTTFSNVLIDNNSVSRAIIFAADHCTYNNLTVTRNLVGRTSYGGGIFSYQNINKMTIRNSILWNNRNAMGGNGPIFYIVTASFPAEVQFINSDIDTTGGSWISGCPGSWISPEVRWIGQNIVADPKFADTLNGDFTLLSQSPCINAGTADTSGLSLPVSDLNGNYRIAGGRIDMGAYESGSGKAPTVLPPSPPVLAAPVDGAGNLQASPTLSWNAVSGATSYHLQVSTFSLFTATIVNDSTIVGTSKSIGPLSLNTTYYWRVRSKNEGGTSAWSATRGFTTAVAVPSAPTLAGPADSAINVQLTTALRWSASAGATLYHLQVSTASGFTAFVVNDSTVSDTSKSVGPLSLATTYYWRARAKNEGGWSAYSSARRFSTIRTTSVEQIDEEIPTEYSLSQNFPNPFNPTTKLRFGIPNAGFVALKVFDLLGRELETLVAEELSAGYYQASWRANVPSGIYFYRLQAGEYVETKKMILLK